MYWFITCFRGRRGRIARASRETPTAPGARRRFAARATGPRRLDIKSQLPLKKGANKSPGDRRGTRGAKKRDVSTGENWEGGKRRHRRPHVAKKKKRRATFFDGSLVYLAIPRSPPSKTPPKKMSTPLKCGGWRCKIRSR